MRSFPFLWQLTCRQNHISVHAHTQCGFMLLSFTPEQRDSPSDQSISIWDTVGERTAGRVSFIQRCGLRVLVWLTFPSVRTVRLSVWASGCFYKAFSYCLLVPMRQTDTTRKYLYVYVCVHVCMWSSYLREAAHVDNNELRWFHGDLSQLVQRKLAIFCRHHDVIQSS